MAPANEFVINRLLTAVRRAAGSGWRGTTKDARQRFLISRVEWW